MKSFADFFSTYGDLHDAVIKSISLDYKEGTNYPLITVRLECMSVAQDYEWVHLEIHFHMCQEYRLIGKHNTDSQVIFNVMADYWENKIAFSFNPNSMESMSIDEHRQSDFYVVCETIDFAETEVIV
jgi:hypothetical protein